MAAGFGGIRSRNQEKLRIPHFFLGWNGIFVVTLVLHAGPLQSRVTMISSTTTPILHDSEELDPDKSADRRALGADPMNRRIIAMLQEDGRVPYSIIARELGTTEGTVRNRVNQMMAAKVLRVIGVADPIALGNEGYALVAMRLGAGADPRSVSARFEACEEVTFVLFATGQYDLVVEVICETHRDLRNFLLEHCYGQADIFAVEPMLALALYKNLMKWGRP
jgi:Lrp/AsnC family transcriptional regulator, regulator for asnA, asnC and gidA